MVVWLKPPVASFPPLKTMGEPVGRVLLAPRASVPALMVVVPVYVLLVPERVNVPVPVLVSERICGGAHAVLDGRRRRAGVAAVADHQRDRRGGVDVPHAHRHLAAGTAEPIDRLKGLVPA